MISASYIGIISLGFKRYYWLTRHPRRCQRSLNPTNQRRITMKVLVPVKRVVDYNVKVRPKSDGSDADLANLKMSINPFCEIAVEEAVLSLIHI